MIDDQVKDDFSMKLKHFLNTPSDTQAFFKEYQSDHPDASFDQYTQSLEKVLERLQKDEFDKRESFCQEVKKLHLPTNQFGC